MNLIYVSTVVVFGRGFLVFTGAGFCIVAFLLLGLGVVGGVQIRQFLLAQRVDFVVLEHTSLRHPFVPTVGLKLGKYMSWYACIDNNANAYFLLQPA